MEFKWSTFLKNKWTKQANDFRISVLLFISGDFFIRLRYNTASNYYDNNMSIGMLLWYLVSLHFNLKGINSSHMEG